MASPKSLQAPLPPMGLTTVDPRARTVDRRPAPRSTTVDQALAMLNVAVTECHYTLDALEAEMAKGRAYIHKVLQGDKPLAYAFVVALPIDVQRRFETLRAESLGCVVVQPVSGEDAIRHLVSGLLGVLRPRKTDVAA